MEEFQFSQNKKERFEKYALIFLSILTTLSCSFYLFLPIIVKFLGREVGNIAFDLMVVGLIMCLLHILYCIIRKKVTHKKFFSRILLINVIVLVLFIYSVIISIHTDYERKMKVREKWRNSEDSVFVVPRD